MVQDLLVFNATLDANAAGCGVGLEEQPMVYGHWHVSSGLLRQGIRGATGFLPRGGLKRPEAGGFHLPP